MDTTQPKIRCRMRVFSGIPPTIRSPLCVSSSFTSGHPPPRSFRGVRWSWCADRAHARPSSGGYHGGTWAMRF